MVLLRDEEDEEGAGGLDLLHLTSGAAAQRAEAAEAGGAARPVSALSGPQAAVPGAEAVGGEGVAPMDGVAPEGAPGGGEQPPAEAAAAGGMASLPPEMREPPPGECDPDVQASGLRERVW